MGIISINVNTTGLVGNSIEPRRCTMITTDSLATIVTAGYLNNQNISGNNILSTDLFEVLYSFNTNTQVGIFGIFQVTYSVSTGFTLNIWENPGDVLLPVVDGNIAMFNGTSGQIEDGGIAANRVLYTSFNTPDVSSNIIFFSALVSAAQLVGQVPVTIYPSTGSNSYKILQLFLNSSSSNFSGGGGNRNIIVTEGFNTFTSIAAADLQSFPGNIAWGNAKLPFPSLTAINTPTSPGQSLLLVYNGGTTDYATGSIVISGLLVRIV